MKYLNKFNNINENQLNQDGHPTIKPGTEKAKEFKDWFESSYIKSGKLDGFIENLK